MNYEMLQVVHASHLFAHSFHGIWMVLGIAFLALVDEGGRGGFLYQCEFSRIFLPWNRFILLTKTLLIEGADKHTHIVKFESSSVYMCVMFE